MPCWVNVLPGCRVNVAEGVPECVAGVPVNVADGVPECVAGVPG